MICGPGGVAHIDEGNPGDDLRHDGGQKNKCWNETWQGILESCNKAFPRWMPSSDEAVACQVQRLAVTAMPWSGGTRKPARNLHNPSCDRLIAHSWDLIGSGDSGRRRI